MKDFLEEYGFAILAAIVVILLITFTTPVGNAVQKSITSTIEQTTARTDNKMKIINNADDVESIQESWTDDYIEFRETHQNVSFDEYKKHLVKVNFNQMFDVKSANTNNGVYEGVIQPDGTIKDMTIRKYRKDGSKVYCSIITNQFGPRGSSGPYQHKSFLENHKYLTVASFYEVSENSVVALGNEKIKNRKSFNVGDNNFIKDTYTIQTALSNDSGAFSFFCESYFDHESYIENPMVFDLTAMFGEGNEPETLEQFKEVFPNDYYEYNEGTEMTVYVPWMEA